MLPASRAGEQFDPDVARSRVGDVVPLRLEVTLFLDVSIPEGSISEVSISDVLVFREGAVDVPIVVVKFVIAVIDTAVA